MLKKIRVILSVILFTLITLYFLDFREVLPESLGILAEIQFIPALLALNIIILVSLIVLTLIFGRVYCSSICPMGIYQDIVAWLSKRFIRKKKYRYSKAKNILRWSVLAATVIAFVFGFTFLVGLLDPYGAYGRMATHLLRPAYLAGNNLLDTIFTSFDNYSFYKVGIYSLGVFSTIIALLTLLTIGYLAWRGGRTWCNTICPVGTTLGLLSKYSLFRIQFVDDKCNMCGLCSMRCKASCIDSGNKQIDYSRCVTCFNCIESCNHDAMKYKLALPGKRRQADNIQVSSYVKKEGMKKMDKTGKPGRTVKSEKPEIAERTGNPQKTNMAERTDKPKRADKQDNDKRSVDESKRRFLSASLVTGLAAGSLIAQEIPEGVIPKRDLKRQVPIAPPGALSFDHLREKCISCHLCVSKCPSHVIKPAFLEYGPGGIMQPKLYFSKGFCNYDCTICGEVCPTGAILPLTKEEKNHTQMGQVRFIVENCIVYHYETNCGACSEHCPTQAVHMVPYKGSLTIPEINPAICVGCGGCEYVCPAIPFKAIYVEGLPSQNVIEIEQEEAEDVVIDDFGF
ncbi:MAG: 4Fe-4S binding protein [Proteiniphilum sp.]|nr:4Fe-4S binding protein [Proteiniphilum sp.]MDD3909212.1 4Fe-4S binding protein [Proteiniphilum sp.]